MIHTSDYGDIIAAIFPPYCRVHSPPLLAYRKQSVAVHMLEAFLG